MSELAYEAAMAGSSVPGQYPEVFASIETLERQVGALEEVVNVLVDHLGPVLRPAVPEPEAAPKKVEEPSGVQVAYQITGRAEKIGELRDRLVRLNARVAI